MTAVELSDLAPPIDVYERALAGHPVEVRLENGTCLALAAEVWSRPRSGDDSVIARCQGATLDVGCGAGRLPEALSKAGIPALGIDVSAQAVQLARGRGSAAVLRDVFARSPSLGRWQHVLLMDGNIGIGGNVAALLRRCRELLLPGGTVLAEVQAPGSGLKHVRARLVHAEQSSRPFRWLVSDAGGIRAAAAAVGLVFVDEWADSGRWFVELSSGNG